MLQFIIITKFDEGLKLNIRMGEQRILLSFFCLKRQWGDKIFVQRIDFYLFEVEELSRKGARFVY